MGNHENSFTFRESPTLSKRAVLIKLPNCDVLRGRSTVRHLLSLLISSIWVFFLKLAQWRFQGGHSPLLKVKRYDRMKTGPLIIYPDIP